MTPSSDYNLTNVKTPVEITAAEQSQVIDVQLVKNGIPVIDARPCDSTNTVTVDCVMVSSIPREYGRVINAGASTSQDGYIYFNFKSADASELISAPNDTNMSVYYFDKEGKIAAKAVVELQRRAIPPVDTTGMALTAVPNDFNISTAGESRAISLYLAKGTDAVSDINIKANFFDPNTGTLNSYIVKTNANGQAVFNYTAPATLPSGNIQVTFDVENPSAPIAQNVTVNFVTITTPPVDTTGMALTAVPNDFNISTADESRAISLYLAKGTDAVSDINIKANFFDPNTGTLNSYIVKTNANGQAVFNYTAPATLPSGNIQVTFDVENPSAPIAQNVTVNFVTITIPPVDTTGMALTAVPNDFNISTAGESRAISLYLAKGTDAVSDINIKANFFDPNTGTLNSYIVKTNANGQAVFNYTAPATLPSGNIQVTFDVENPSASIAQNVTVNFVTITTPPVDTTGMALTAVPNDFNISTAGESRAISLYLAKGTDAVSDINIKANFFDPNTGTLNSYIVKTNANGQAVFNYTAPATLPSGNIQVTFDVENPSAPIAQNVTVNFVTITTPPVDTSKYVMTAIPEYMIIDTTGKTHTIKLYLEDNSSQPSRPVENAEILAGFFNPNQGTLDTYTGTTDANGQVSFAYTTPSDLNVSDMNITFVTNIAGQTETER